MSRRIGVNEQIQQGALERGDVVDTQLSINGPARRGRAAAPLQGVHYAGRDDMWSLFGGRGGGR